MPTDGDDRTFDQRSVARDVESCAASHRALTDHLESLDGVDPASPSRLPGWTIGHVLTHIARNGDSHHELLAGRPQYPSAAARNADIETGSTRSWDELVVDVGRSGRSVDEAYATHADWGRPVPTFAGERPAHMLPLLRQREVEIHRIDLGLGYEFDALPGDYVRRELRVLQMLWTARQPMGLTTLPRAVLASAPTDRLAWLFGRVEIDGVEPAAIF